MILTSPHDSAVEAGRTAEDLARELGVSKHTIYAWKSKYGGMDVSEAQEVKDSGASPFAAIPRSPREPGSFRYSS